MTQSSPQSVIIVGGGITGLTVAVALRASGYKVTLVARDAVEDTASGVAAGMIAPAMEAMNDPDPAFSFQRLKAAQQAWLELWDIWPEAFQAALAEGQLAPALYLWPVGIPSPDMHAAGVLKRLSVMHASHSPLSWEEMMVAGYDPEVEGLTRIADDWLVDATAVLAILEAHIQRSGGQIMRTSASHVTAKSVELIDGDVLSADHVVLAAGYGARAFAADVPALASLNPIKGHLLDMAGRGGAGIVRSGRGYFADYGVRGKFGATMQAGQDDLAVEPDVVADLIVRASQMNIEAEASTPRTGIRASTPDEWPIIGRDPASGVLVATGMRRNGYVFAPMAAKIILALVEGRESPDGGIYRPDRFRNPEN